MLIIFEIIRIHDKCNQINNTLFLFFHLLHTLITGYVYRSKQDDFTEISSFVKQEFWQLVHFSTKFVILNQSSCKTTILYDIQTDQIEPIKIYGSTIVKNYNWKNLYLTNL
jgi:hypothetical protein